MAEQEENQFDVFMAALRKKGVTHAMHGKPEQAFINLQLPVPEHPQQFLDILLAQGEITFERVNDEVTADRNAPIKKACLEYQPS